MPKTLNQQIPLESY